MQHLLSKKVVNVAPPDAIHDNTGLACNVIDTQGFADCEIIVSLGATDIALAALKVQESDVKASATTLTGGADITGTVFGTDANDTGSTSTLPSATADNNLYSVKIDLRGRKRYLLPVVTFGDGTAGGFGAVIALLARAQDAPRTAVEAGFAQRMVV